MNKLSSWNTWGTDSRRNSGRNGMECLRAVEKLDSNPRNEVLPYVCYLVKVSTREEELQFDPDIGSLRGRRGSWVGSMSASHTNQRLFKHCHHLTFVVNVIQKTSCTYFSQATNSNHQRKQKCPRKVSIYSHQNACPHVNNNAITRFLATPGFQRFQIWWNFLWLCSLICIRDT